MELLQTLVTKQILALRANIKTIPSTCSQIQNYWSDNSVGNQTNKAIIRVNTVGYKYEPEDSYSFFNP
jgi:hypothetical protein